MGILHRRGEGIIQPRCLCSFVIIRQIRHQSLIPDHFSNRSRWQSFHFRCTFYLPYRRHYFYSALSLCAVCGILLFSASLFLSGCGAAASYLSVSADCSANDQSHRRFSNTHTTVNFHSKCVRVRMLRPAQCAISHAYNFKFCVVWVRFPIFFVNSFSCIRILLKIVQMEFFLYTLTKLKSSRLIFNFAK